MVKIAEPSQHLLKHGGRFGSSESTQTCTGYHQDQSTLTHEGGSGPRRGLGFGVHYWCRTHSLHGPQPPTSPFYLLSVLPPPYFPPGPEAVCIHDPSSCRPGQSPLWATASLCSPTLSHLWQRERASRHCICWNLSEMRVPRSKVTIGGEAEALLFVDSKVWIKFTLLCGKDLKRGISTIVENTLSGIMVPWAELSLAYVSRVASF